MTERPILFSAPMVRALLDGTKTQTRRPYKARKHPDFGCEMAAFELAGSPQHVIDRMCPYGQPGARLWVRETWAPHPDFPDTVRRGVYRADPECKYDVARWRPSIHMPRWASRILLEVVSVRVERLQDISEADAMAEGCRQNACGPDYLLTKRWAYRALWESINGAGSWDGSPWVWVVEFKRVTP